MEKGEHFSNYFGEKMLTYFFSRYDMKMVDAKAGSRGKEPFWRPRHDNPSPDRQPAARRSISHSKPSSAWCHSMAEAVSQAVGLRVSHISPLSSISLLCAIGERRRALTFHSCNNLPSFCRVHRFILLLFNFAHSAKKGKIFAQLADASASLIIFLSPSSFSSIFIIFQRLLDISKPMVSVSHVRPAHILSDPVFVYIFFAFINLTQNQNK